MSGLVQFLTRGFCLVFRLCALLVLGLLLYFPAFKGMPAGYVPLVFGGLLLVILRTGVDRFAPLVERMSQQWFFVALILLPVVLQLLLVIVFRSQPSFDGFFVYREAVALLETGRMNPLTYYAPAQVWYYAFFFKLFGTAPITAQLCQIPLAALLPVLVYLLGRQAGSAQVARWAALGVALYPGLLLYLLVTPYYYYLYTAFILLMVFSWLRLQGRASDWFPAFWGGLSAGGGALAKAVLLIAPVQTVFFLILTAGTFFQRRIWLAGALFILAMAAAILPWTVRNFRVFGEPIMISTSGPLVIYSANNPRSNGLYSSLPDETHVATPQEMLAHGKRCGEQARSFIRSHPAAFARLVWLKILHTWGTETSFVELINLNGQPLGRWNERGLRLLVQTGWAALVLAWAATATTALFRRAPPTALEIATAIIVLSKFIVYSVYEGGARHHLPAVPLLILLVVAMRKPCSNPEACPGKHKTARPSGWRACGNGSSGTIPS
jgi:4-amino-4-deoxy-L-arabinose transferase-like glycosyltransferase